MSAFVVTTEHVDAIIASALHYGNDWAGTSWYWGNPGRSGKLTHENTDAVGAMLFAENTRAVEYRYEGRYNVPDYAAIPYTYREPARILTIVEALKAVRCLQYQCAEPDDYKQTEAWAFLEAVQDMLITKLDGWDGAPWGLDADDLRRPTPPAPVPTKPTPAKRRAASACADPATCWQWDHACWSKRMKRGRAAAAAPAPGPAMMRGTIVPNERLAA